jgi:hypothetical protein
VKGIVGPGTSNPIFWFKRTVEILDNKEACATTEVLIGNGVVVVILALILCLSGHTQLLFTPAAGVAGAASTILRLIWSKMRIK